MAQAPKISRIEAVVNVASGGANAQDAEQMRALLAGYGAHANVQVADSGEIERRLRSAVDAAPDLLVILAGDGTARAAADMAGPQGPMIAPLPGGTMNMLPHAVYGAVPWREALTDALESGVERDIGGGLIEGRSFLVAAILGAPALWAPAREAVREGQLRLAFARMRRAWRRAFSGRLRYALDDGPRGKAEALAFLCPLASTALSDEAQSLEAAIIDPQTVGEAARIGFKALVDDWRNDPAVRAGPCRRARVWAASRVPAVLDGEPVWLATNAAVDWRPQVARLLAPRREAG
ncbi:MULTISPECIES: diacylglycerol kinase family protein [unclassified Phenylobacterium]|uniref:diacylglycerol/lipid kinase family protein n=1 Tax=unclassified Phenylobacterium TaxID=2640670 RepID=UPI0022B2E27D|nr:diacylglycerol kinase family protein [Phenylobacterium sp. NIBR 498073]MBS0489419.1 diacylglycerol kinase family lipid kinase [Pseudomonadota bacterium]WGU40677.1 diacylglycerol kinase family protein [Phenylobacterium sp. NIBR 498073]